MVFVKQLTLKNSYITSEMEIEELSKRVAYALMDKKLTLCTAEECTCGLIGASIASQDYAQRWYKGGIVTYTELEASKIFDIEPRTILKCDFVSAQVTQQMAMSALSLFETNVAVVVVGYVDKIEDSDVNSIQICVGKTIGGTTSFKYKKLNVNESSKGENIEVAIKEALRMTLEHIIEN